MAEQFDDLVAVVVGGGTALGAAIVRHLSGAGARVAALDRSLEAVEPGVLAIRSDLSDDAALLLAIEEAEVRYGQLDIFIDTLGGLPGRARVALPLLRESDKAAIVAVGPIGKRSADTRRAAREATVAMAAELAAESIRINRVDFQPIDDPPSGRDLERIVQAVCWLANPVSAPTTGNCLDLHHEPPEEAPPAGE